METSLFQIRQRESFGFSAENPTGTREGGTHAKDCEKLRPCIDIEPGETVVLCDTDGPGMITHTALPCACRSGTSENNA